MDALAKLQDTFPPLPVTVHTLTPTHQYSPWVTFQDTAKLHTFDPSNDTPITQSPQQKLIAQSLPAPDPPPSSMTITGNVKQLPHR